MPTNYYVARAGGGQHFSSSHSSSSGGDTSTSSHSNFFFIGGGGGASSGGGGGFIFGLILLVVIGVVIFLVVRHFRKSVPPAAQETMQEPSISAPEPTSNVDEGLAKIQAADSNFNLQMFKDKTANAFYKIQEAWEKQDMNIARPFVSEAIMQRYSNQIVDLKSRGEKNILENIVVGSMNCAKVDSDANYDYITIRIDASMADYTVDNTGKLISGDKSDQPFTEDWTMLRSLGTTTNIDKQLKDNKCPNCGAPLQINASGKCNYCGAVVSSGQFDWVLSEISQVV